MFNLSRHFSWASLALIALAAASLGLSYHRLSVGQLQRMAEDRNVAMTEVFRNSLWPRFVPLVQRSYGMDPATLRAQPELAELGRAVAALMYETAVIKVKVYNRDGFTVFSSDPRQIGENKAGNPGLQRALANGVASELTHRNSIDAFEGVMVERDLISSYVPLHDPQQQRVDGVFELYQDVTPYLAYLRHTLWQVAALVGAVFLLLYLVQFLVVRRAHRILRQQDAALKRSLAQIEAANATLEQRVQERTADLEQEVAERRQAEARLDYLAHHDPLTGLPNRLHFNQRLTERLQPGTRLAVLFIDLDQFKHINDTLGHPSGDQLLREIAARLRSRLPATCDLARLGGDEFICIAPRAAENPTPAAIAETLLDALRAPIQLAGQELFLSACIGISLYPDDGDSTDALLRNADTALYRAKAHGRGHHHFYTPEMTAHARERLQLEQQLRRALDAALAGAADQGGLALAYQAQVDLASGLLTGAEALARWTLADGSSVSPMHFIAIAEETGLIVPLGEWVLRQACAQLCRWDAAGLQLPRLSVNLSVRQLERPEMLATLQQVLQAHGLAPERLELEITESVLMEMDDALEMLQQLRRLGLHLSIDDFGTGYSSLSYLKLLPVSKLKIDRAFVVGIGQGRDDEAIIEAVVALARSLRLEVLAEGVETMPQAEFLLRTGCPVVQGYLHGRPVDAERFSGRWRGRSAPCKPLRAAAPAAATQVADQLR